MKMERRKATMLWVALSGIINFVNLVEAGICLPTITYELFDDPGCNNPS